MTQMAKHDMCVSLRPSMLAINHPVMNLDTANPEFLFKNVDVFFCFSMVILKLFLVNFVGKFNDNVMNSVFIVFSL